MTSTSLPLCIHHAGGGEGAGQGAVADAVFFVFGAGDEDDFTGDGIRFGGGELAFEDQGAGLAAAIADG